MVVLCIRIVLMWIQYFLLDLEVYYVLGTNATWQVLFFFFNKTVCKQCYLLIITTLFTMLDYLVMQYKALNVILIDENWYVINYVEKVIVILHYGNLFWIYETTFVSCWFGVLVFIYSVPRHLVDLGMLMYTCP